jgi:hypothetical protein
MIKLRNEAKTKTIQFNRSFNTIESIDCVSLSTIF